MPNMLEVKSCSLCNKQPCTPFPSPKKGWLITACENGECPIHGYFMPLDCWNTRPVEDALQVEIEQLKTQAKDLKSRIVELEDAQHIARSGQWYSIVDIRTPLLEEIEQLKEYIAVLEETYRWIPVSERMPKEGTDIVIIWHYDGYPNDSHLDITEYRADEIDLHTSDGDFDKTVTHWLLVFPPPVRLAND